MRTLLILSLLAVTACTTRYAPATSSPPGLGPLVGEWEGELTYTDYGDDTSQSSLPITAHARAVEDPKLDASGILLDVSYTEPDGSSGGSSRTVLTPLPDRPDRFGYDGEEWTLVSSTAGADGLSVTIERAGTDNNRPATIRHLLRYVDDTLQDRTMVRYEGTDAFFERNRVHLARR